jgi:hypothetical protein
MFIPDTFVHFVIHSFIRSVRRGHRRVQWFKSQTLDSTLKEWMNSFVDNSNHTNLYRFILWSLLQFSFLLLFYTGLLAILIFGKRRVMISTIWINQ